MALLSVNGARVLECILTLPRVGCWHADLMIDQQANLVAGSPVQLLWEDAGVTFVGTVLRQGVFADFLRVRVAGGAGALYKATALPKAYRGVPLQLPLKDILTAAGETLSTSADPTTIQTVVQRWTIIRQGAVPAIRSLLANVPNTSWRILPDGTFWCGPEVYPVVDGTFDFILESQHTGIGKAEIATEGPSLAPGTSFLGQQVSYVQHKLDEAGFRTLAFFEV